MKSIILKHDSIFSIMEKSATSYSPGKPCSLATVSSIFEANTDSLSRVYMACKQLGLLSMQKTTPINLIKLSLLNRGSMSLVVANLSI